MAVNFEKRVEKVRVVLKKRNILTPTTVRAGAALDASGSAKWMYEKHIMEECHQRLMALAGPFDDNGELDGWVFSEKHKQLETAKVADYGNWVHQEIWSKQEEWMWDGTLYAPAMEDIAEFYFPESMAEASVKASGSFLSRLFGAKAKPQAAAPVRDMTPAWNMFITDGQNSDRARAEAALQASQKYPLYWTLIGVGNPREFGFLQQMADKLPNVGFLNLSSLDIEEEALYEQVITEEFCTWVRGHE
ncbi:VWA domain-containing protein [Paraburkholderia sp. UCT31]|uniref:VWA domain-containing protein n=1 Tax=Paraburkholderia sp. UCT31 TaxID=2615209 RepID=UPI001654FE8D|nr:VWA domain-containing protein [Paraburkholderia sp. UCT31]MBC8741820.1 VWA domain-containing protein [Paraburkholderia sp. UCT31]